jgi:hypothetical protein
MPHDFRARKAQLPRQAMGAERLPLHIPNRGGHGRRDRTAQAFAGSGSARAGAMISWCRRGEALVAWGYLPIERARDVVTTTYNRAVSLFFFSLPQDG